MPCTVARAGGTDRHPILRLSIAASREEAIRIQGWELLAAGGQLDDLPHYTVGELLDAEVRTDSGVLLGTVSDVLQAPAHELLEIAAPSGRTLLVPLVDELVAFDVESRQVRVADGLLDEDAEG